MNRLAQRVCPLLLVLLLAASCGRGPAATPDGGAADSLAAADSAPPDASAMRPDRGPRPDLVPGPVEGLVYLQEIVAPDANGAQQGSALAFFTPRPMPFFTPLKQLGGGCAIYPPDEVGPVQYSAGKVTFSGGTQTVTLQPDLPRKPGDWLYPGILFPDMFSPGSSITVSASGGQLPAFSGTVRGAGELQVTFPTGTVPRSKPVVLSFPPAPATLWVFVTALQGSQPRTTIRCAGSALQGSFTIPTSVISQLYHKAETIRLGAGLVSESRVEPSARLRVHLLTMHIQVVERPLK